MRQESPPVGKGPNTGCAGKHRGIRWLPGKSDPRPLRQLAGVEVNPTQRCVAPCPTAGNLQSANGFAVWVPGGFSRLNWLGTPILCGRGRDPGRRTTPKPSIFLEACAPRRLRPGWPRSAILLRKSPAPRVKPGALAKAQRRHGSHILMPFPESPGHRGPPTARAGEFGLSSRARVPYRDCSPGRVPLVRRKAISSTLAGLRYAAGTRRARLPRSGES